MCSKQKMKEIYKRIPLETKKLNKIVQPQPP